MPTATPARNGPKDTEASPPFIEARDLAKRFGGVSAVDGMSITLRRGEMAGLIGRASCRERV